MFPCYSTAHMLPHFITTALLTGLNQRRIGNFLLYILTRGNSFLGNNECSLVMPTQDQQKRTSPVEDHAYGGSTGDQHKLSWAPYLNLMRKPEKTNRNGPAW